MPYPNHDDAATNRKLSRGSPRFRPNYKKEIENIENNMRRREAANEENRKWRARLEVAEALYAKMKKEFEQKERKTFLELNKNVQLN